MKALVKTRAGPGGMRCKEVLEPVPRGEDLKVKALACGICGMDIHLRHDRYPCRLPVVRGHEFSEVVTEVGKNVRQFRPDGRVITLTATDTCEECEWCRGKEDALAGARFFRNSLCGGIRP